MDTLPFIIICVCILAGIITAYGAIKTISGGRRSEAAGFRASITHKTKNTNNIHLPNRAGEKPAGVSAIAEQILAAASQGPFPEITVKKELDDGQAKSGAAFSKTEVLQEPQLYINTYGRIFCTREPEEKLKYEAAVEELLEHGLVKMKRKDVYSVTADGLELAQKRYT